MEQKNQPIGADPAKNDNVVAFDAARRMAHSAPLSDDEIIQLRQLLKSANVVITSCPIARRSLEDVGLA